MTRMLFTVLLPLTLPILIYGIYLVLARRRTRRAEAGQAPGWQDAPWTAILCAGVLLMLGALIYYRETAAVAPGIEIVPPSYVDGEIRPSHPVE